MELVKLVAAVIGGGGLVKLFNLFWSKKAADIKSLSDIIDKMDERIKAQDVRIAILEGALTKKDRVIIDYEQQNTRYERAFNKKCEQDNCPIWQSFKKLTENELG